MIELTVSIYLLCVGFIAALWDREHQTGPLGGQENEGLNQAFKAALRTDSSTSESEDPRPESNLVRPTSPAEVRCSRESDRGRFRIPQWLQRG